MSAAPSQPYRLSGGLIDRGKPLRASFDGQEITGFAGDTLASALLANGIRLVGRSFKYHRPRGILTAGPEEPNALVELRSGARREPNTRATTTELFDGLEATSQNRWPSLGFDILSISSLFSPVFSAGFYYKTFMWPSAFWERVYEPLIRRAAGLGRAASEVDPDHYEQAFAFCDILIIGSGPAGLTAAQTAARSGARVILCEQDFAFGGRLLTDGREIDGLSGYLWAQGIVDELYGMPNVRLMPRTCVFGIYDTGTYGALERVGDHFPVPPPHQPRQRLWRIVAKRAILAAGAIERPIVFGGNDRIGVMMASAVRSYINRFAASPGRHIALFTNNDDGWRTARAWRRRVWKSRQSSTAAPKCQRIWLQCVQSVRIIRRRRRDRDQRRPTAEFYGTHGRRLGIYRRGYAGDLGRMESRSGADLSSRRAAGVERRIISLRAGRDAAGLAAAGAANGRMLLRDCLRDGAEVGRAAMDESGFTGLPFRYH